MLWFHMDVQLAMFLLVTRIHCYRLTTIFNCVNILSIEEVLLDLTTNRMERAPAVSIQLIATDWPTH